MEMENPDFRILEKKLDNLEEEFEALLAEKRAKIEMHLAKAMDELKIACDFAEQEKVPFGAHICPLTNVYTPKIIDPALIKKYQQIKELDAQLKDAGYPGSEWISEYSYEYKGINPGHMIENKPECWYGWKHSQTGC